MARDWRGDRIGLFGLAGLGIIARHIGRLPSPRKAVVLNNVAGGVAGHSILRDTELLAEPPDGRVELLGGGLDVVTARHRCWGLAKEILGITPVLFMILQARGGGLTDRLQRFTLLFGDLHFLLQAKVQRADIVVSTEFSIVH